MEKDEILRGVPSNSLYDTSTLIPATAAAAYGSIPAPRAAAAVDFRQCVSAKTLALVVFFPCYVILCSRTNISVK